MVLAESPDGICGSRWWGPVAAAQIYQLGAALTTSRQTEIGAPNGGSRVSHDRGAVTVRNEAPLWQGRCLGQSGYVRLALADAQQRYDVLPGLTRTVTPVWGW